MELKKLNIFLVALKIVFAIVLGICFCVAAIVITYVLSWISVIHYSSRKAKKEEKSKTRTILNTGDENANL